MLACWTGVPPSPSHPTTTHKLRCPGDGRPLAFRFNRKAPGTPVSFLFHRPSTGPITTPFLPNLLISAELREEHGLLTFFHVKDQLLHYLCPWLPDQLLIWKLYPRSNLLLLSFSLPFWSPGLRIWTWLSSSCQTSVKWRETISSLVWMLCF